MSARKATRRPSRQDRNRALLKSLPAIARTVRRLLTQIDEVLALRKI